MQLFDCSPRPYAFPWDVSKQTTLFPPVTRLCSVVNVHNLYSLVFKGNISSKHLMLSCGGHAVIVLWPAVPPQVDVALISSRGAPSTCSPGAFLVEG